MRIGVGQDRGAGGCPCPKLAGMGIWGKGGALGRRPGPGKGLEAQLGWETLWEPVFGVWRMNWDRSIQSGPPQLMWTDYRGHPQQEKDPPIFVDPPQCRADGE